jgi:hypothetical protein
MPIYISINIYIYVFEYFQMDFLEQKHFLFRNLVSIFILLSRNVLLIYNPQSIKECPFLTYITIINPFFILDEP